MAEQTDISATSVNVVSPTQITCSINLAGAQAGQWNVVVTNPDSQSGTGTNLFTVNSPAPTVTGITPATGNRGWPVSITNLAGTGFQPGAATALTRTGQSDITGTSVTVVSPTQITCTYNLLGVYVGTGTTGTSTWNVRVTNSDSQSGSRTNGFTVSSPRPALTSCTPNSGARGTTVSITNLAGTGFQPGATVTFTRSPTTITMTSVNVISSTQIAGTIVIPSGATTGAYTVTVTNTDGRTRTASLFTVT
jgi:hypothetical protein